MIDSIILLILFLFFLKGYWLGDTRELISVLAITLSLLIAYLPAKGILKDMQAAGFPKEIGAATGFAISALLFYPFIYLLIDFISKDLNYFGKKVPAQKRILGSCFSLLKGIIFLCLVFTVIHQLPIRSGLIERSFLIPYMSLY